MIMPKKREHCNLDAMLSAFRSCVSRGWHKLHRKPRCSDDCQPRAWFVTGTIIHGDNLISARLKVPAPKERSVNNVTCILLLVVGILSTFLISRILHVCHLYVRLQVSFTRHNFFGKVGKKTGLFRRTYINIDRHAFSMRCLFAPPK